MTHGGVIDPGGGERGEGRRGKAYVLRTKVKDEDGVKGGMGNLLVGHGNGMGSQNDQLLEWRGDS